MFPTHSPFYHLAEEVLSRWKCWNKPLKYINSLSVVLFLIHFISSATVLELVCCLLPEASAATQWHKMFTTHFPPARPPNGAFSPSGQEPTPYRGFTTTLGRTPQDERSARCRDLSTWQYITLKRQIPAIPKSERPQTQTLDHTPTGIDVHHSYKAKYHTCECYSL